ncbi:MAG: peptide deformylase [Planctomycetota bacterium]
MEVVIYPDPALRRGGEEVKEFGESLRTLAAGMLEAMYAQGGVGLAAPQVAVPKKLLVLNPKGSKEDRTGEMVLVNPRIRRRKGYEWGDEGCLSFPGIQAEVERSQKITVEYRDLSGEPVELRAEGWLARIVQHEMDHLEGVLFVDRLTAADKIRVRPQLEEMERRYRARVG